MVKVVPADEQKSREILSASGLADGVCLTMTEQEKELGYAVYRLDGNKAELTAVKSSEYPLIELLVRAALNSAQIRGAEEMHATDERIVAILAPFRFHPTADGVYVNIDEFFNRKCAGESGCADCAAKQDQSP